MEKKYKVSGMTCSACSAAVERAVKKLDGVDSVNVNLLTGVMDVGSKGQIDDSAIRQAVTGAGYGFVEEEAKVEGREDRAANDDEQREMRFRIAVSFGFLIPLMYISMHHMFSYPIPGIFVGDRNALTMAFTQLLLTLPVMYVNRKYYIVGFKTLLKLSPNMDSLIAIGSSAAVVYGVFAIYRIGHGLAYGEMELVSTYAHSLYFESAAMILALITLGKYLEARAKGRTGEAVSKLLELSPKTATVIRNGQELEISATELVVGDLVVVRPGQRIAADGTVIEGSSAVDESALTGESIPAYKTAGDTVSAATINQSGNIKFEVTKTGEDTTLAQIIRLVEEAGGSKAPIAKLADKISGVFVPIVIAIAVITFAVWMIVGQGLEFSLTHAISVLVISCPCALGLATPVAIMVGMGVGAQNGVLVKTAEALETLSHVKTAVVDKTGTLTNGLPVVTDLVAFDGGEERLLTLAASIERLSEHPLASAVVKEAESKALEFIEVSEFENVPGRGIKGFAREAELLGGNRKFMVENGIDPTPAAEAEKRLSEEGKTPLFFALEGRLIGLIAAADMPKPSSRAAVSEFAALGVDLVMLTGDNETTARVVGGNLGIKSIIAGILPQDKDAEVRKLQDGGQKVVMIGDGINDAPALVRADVGIAIGAGTDIAIESADIILTRGDLLDAVTAIRLSRAVIRNIKLNLFWAFFYNIIGIPIAAGVFYNINGWTLNPMFAAAAMSLSSIFVVTNALRLKLFKAERLSDTPPEDTGSNDSAKAIVSANSAIGDESMEKTIGIEGMSCGHCSARVEKALSALENVKEVSVDLDKKSALVKLSGEVSDQRLKEAVTEAGYEVMGIN